MTKRLVKLSVVLSALVVVGAIAAAAAQAATGPGSELDYATAGTVNVAAASTSSSTATTIVTGGSVTYDGSTKVRVCVVSPAAESGGANALVIGLYLDGTYQGAIWEVQAGTGNYVGVNGCQELTPASGAHTFSIRAWQNQGSGGQVAGTTQLSVTQVSGSWATSSGSSTLAGLTDVNVASPADGDVLTYSSSASKWTNKPDTDPASASAPACGVAGTPACTVDVSTGANGGAALVDIRHLSGWLVGLTICALCMPLIAFLLNRGSAP